MNTKPAFSTPLTILITAVVVGVLSGVITYSSVASKKDLEIEDLKERLSQVKEQAQAEPESMNLDTSEIQTKEETIKTPPTPATTDETANWKTFNSKYFNLSFDIPQEFNVEEGQNYIWVAAPQPPPGPDGTIYNFLQFSRYTESETKNTEIERAKTRLKNLVQDSIIIDGAEFLRISGNPFRNIDGKDEIDQEKIVYIFLDKFDIVVLGGNSELVDNQDPIKLSNEIVATIKFSQR